MTLPPRSRRFRLTDLFVRTAPPGRHADGDCLYLYVKDTGARSWVVRAQFDGLRRDFGLGGYPRVSLAEARRRVEQIVDVLRAGGDPRADAGGGDPRADARRRSVPLVRDFVETVIADRRPTWSCTATEGSWRHCFATHVFPVVGDWLVSDVTLEVLRGIVNPLWDGRGSKGYILRQRLDCVMRCAIAYKHRSDNPAAELKVLLRKVKREPTHHPSLPHAGVTDAMRDLHSLWRKSRIRPGPGAVEFRTLNGMAMGKRPAARQASPMWVDTADLPTNDGHPYFERLNRVLADSGFDAFVEELCAAFYADRLGRPSLRPGRYFRMLFIGYFEGLSSERGIAWRVADSLSLRSFLDLELTEAAPDHSTLSRTRRRIDVETHEAVFTWILERLSAAGLVRGKTVGIDATTLEANAAMRSIERRDTGESHEAFIRRLAEASGVETPTRADLARFDRSRKNKKTSNKEWKSPQDPDAKVAKMKDGRTHMAHKAEHGVDMDTGAIVSVTVQDASDGDTATLPATLIMAAEQVELVQPDGPGVEEVVADKGYHSDETLVALGAVGVQSHVSEPERGRRCWQDKKTGETPPEKRAAQKALYANRRRVRGRRGRRLQRCRGEVVERTFAHMYETGGMRRVWVRGHENVRKRVLLQAAACNIGLLLRSQTGIGTPRSLQGRAVSAICRLIGRLIDRWGCLTRAWGSKWTPATLAGSIAHRQAA